MNYALENGQASAATILRNFDGEPTTGDRAMKLRELATKEINSFPDFRKALVKQLAQKKDFGKSEKKLNREDIEFIQKRGRHKYEKLMGR